MKEAPITWEELVEKQDGSPLDENLDENGVSSYANTCPLIVFERRKLCVGLSSPTLLIISRVL